MCKIQIIPASRYFKEHVWKMKSISGQCSYWSKGLYIFFPSLVFLQFSSIFFSAYNPQNHDPEWRNLLNLF